MMKRMALAAVLVLALLAGSARYSHAGSSWNAAGAVIGGFGLGMVFGHALAHPHYVVVAPPPPPPPPVYYYYPYPYPVYPYYYGYPRLHGPVYHRRYGRW
jgi:hypothetical protein